MTSLSKKKSNTYTSNVLVKTNITSTKLNRTIKLFTSIEHTYRCHGHIFALYKGFKNSPV